MQYTIKRGARIHSIDADILIKFLLLLIWPVGALLFSLATPKSKSSLAVFFIFGLLFGWSLDFQGGMYMDIIHVIERFHKQQITSSSDLQRTITYFFAGNGQDRDLYNILINWVTLQFTTNYHCMYLIAAIPFMLFMVGSINTITSSPKFKNGIYGTLLVFLFILPKDFFTLQNFRFATATWMAIFCTIRYFTHLKSGYLKYLLGLLCLPLIHSSFYFYDIVFAIYAITRFFKIRYKTAFIFFCCSIPFAFFNFDVMSAVNVNILPRNIGKWAELYLSEKAASNYGTYQLTGSRMYLVCTFGKFISYFYGTYILTKSLKGRESSELNAFMIFFLIFFGFVNIVQFVPVLGFRFFDLARILFIFLWFIMEYPRKNRYLLLILLFCTYDIIYAGIDHYARSVDPSFWISDIFSLMNKYI